MGHRSREAGKAFEERIENALECARQQRIVPWFKHQHPLRTMRGLTIEAAGADFVGFLAGAANVAIECKSALEHKGATRIRRSWFTEEQETHLNAAHASGGLSLAALEFRDEARGDLVGMLMPWVAVPWTTPKSAESVALEDIHPKWRIPPENTIARLVVRCPTCFAYLPLHGVRRTCCGGVPF